MPLIQCFESQSERRGSGALTANTQVKRECFRLRRGCSSFYWNVRGGALPEHKGDAHKNGQEEELLHAGILPKRGGAIQGKA